MSHTLHARPSLLAVGLLTALLGAGCSSRSDPCEYTINVTSPETGAAATFSGFVTVDGQRSEIGPMTTPWRNLYRGSMIDAELRTADPRGLMAEVSIYDKPATLTAVNKVIGPGCLQIHDNTLAGGKARGVQILAVPATVISPVQTP